MVIRRHLIQASSFTIKETWVQGGDTVLIRSHNQLLTEQRLQTRLQSYFLESSLPLSQGATAFVHQSELYPALIFLPVLNCQTWSLWLLSKSSFSTFHPESPLNSFVLVSKLLACVRLNTFPWHSEISINQPVTKTHSILPAFSELSWVLQGIEGRYKCPFHP